MKHHLLKEIAIAIALLCLPTVAAASDLAITDVTVVNTRTGALIPHCTVVIRDGKITTIGNNSAPISAEIVSGRGKFLIPGLWDMVTHVSWTRANAFPVLVANGITSVRDEGGDFAETAVWAAAIKGGTLLGPTIFQVGPMLNGKSFNRYQYALGSPEEAQGAVRLLRFQGVDGLEIERRVPRDVYFALLAEAKAAGLSVGGKVPINVTPAEASNAGQTTIDNIETIYDDMFRASHEADMVGGMDTFLRPGGEGDTLFATLQRNGTAVTPCLATFASVIVHNDPSALPDLNYRYVAKSQRRPAKPIPAEQLADFRMMVPQLMKTIARLQAAGVTLLAGTDIAGDRVPGFSLHAELDTLSQAGLTPLQVLQSATLNPAVVMRRTAEYGTVEPGKVADLVLLDADPSRSVEALHRISAVVLHGRLLNRSMLDEQLKQAASQAEHN